MAEKEDDIVARAHRRFKECQEWEGDAHQRFKNDIVFLYGDSDNQQQWDAAVRARRQIAGQPMVTINKVHTHWLHVVNQMKENRPAISIKPKGDEATYDSAQIFQSVVRHIEQKSKADVAYKIASENQVGGGVGYWRIVTEYADDDTFDQEICIRQVPDPLCVYLDPYAKNRDGSDARFGFLYEMMPREKFEAKYPNIRAQSTQESGNQSWIQKDCVRVAHYYEVEMGKEWLYARTMDDGATQYMRESELDPNERSLLAQLVKMGNESITRRRVDKRKICQYMIAGNKIVEKSVWPGKYIPLVRVIGEEVVIEGRLDRKGLVRYLKDAQRAYNYNTSASLEYGALQTKSPYMAPVEAVEGLENYWANANTQNFSYLPYNHADENGNPIPQPQRVDPPTSAPAYLQGMQAAEHEMMMASGQYESTFSEQGNEVSGISIEQRQKQGERVTFHFLDNLCDAIRYTGEQLIDLIPKIYDTKRVIRMVAEDGEEQTVTIDPQAQKALQMQEQGELNKVQAIFNPSIGCYDVVAEAGPSFNTKREQAFDAMTQIVATNPQMANVIGDLYMGTADFPVADKLQERMRNWINATNPGILGEGPSPQEQQLMQQNQQLMGIVQQMQQQLNEKQSALDIENRRVDMDALNHLALRMENERKDMLTAFKAETERLGTLLKNVMNPVALAEINEKTAAEILRAPDPAAKVDQSQFSSAQTFALGMPAVTQHGAM